MDQRVRKLRRVFRHLKSGVYPPDLIDEFTVGRNSELEVFRIHFEELLKGSSQYSFIEGRYGRGKSHFLKAIEALALRKGFAVSWVILDGQNHAFNHPTRYLHSFLENLCVSDSPHRGLSSLVRFWLRGEKADSLTTWANKYAPYWLSMPIKELLQDHQGLQYNHDSIDARIECRDLIRCMGQPWFSEISRRIQAVAELVRAAGFNGVVYLFDELETIGTLLTTIRQRLLSYEFLNLLIDGRKHSYCSFVFATTPDLSDKIASDRLARDYYESIYPESFRFIEKWNGELIDILSLRQLNRMDIIKLCRLLRDYHGEAFMWSMNDGSFTDEFINEFIVETERLSMGIREVVKAFVNLLELAEQYPSENIGRLCLINKSLY